MSEQTVTIIACGCRLLVGQGMAAIEYCPLHKAAPEMLRALKWIETYIANQPLDSLAQFLITKKIHDTTLSHFAYPSVRQKKFHRKGAEKQK